MSFVVAEPVYTFLGRTLVVAADREDGAERGAVLLGRRLDVKKGERLTVRVWLTRIDGKPRKMRTDLRSSPSPITLADVGWC